MVLSRTNIEKKVFTKNKKTDWYLTADEMLANGMIDNIVTDIDEIL